MTVCPCLAAGLLCTCPMQKALPVCLETGPPRCTQSGLPGGTELSTRLADKRQSALAGCMDAVSNRKPPPAGPAQAACAGLASLAHSQEGPGAEHDLLYAAQPWAKSLSAGCSIGSNQHALAWARLAHTWVGPSPAAASCPPLSHTVQPTPPTGMWPAREPGSPLNEQQGPAGGGPRTAPPSPRARLRSSGSGFLAAVPAGQRQKVRGMSGGLHTRRQGQGNKPPRELVTPWPSFYCWGFYEERAPSWQLTC